MKSIQNFPTKVKFFVSEKNQTFSKKCEIYDQFNVEKLEIFQKFSDKYFHQGVDDFLSNIRFPEYLIYRQSLYPITYTKTDFII